MASFITNINLNISTHGTSSLDADGNGTLTSTSNPVINNTKGTGDYCFLASGTFGSGRTLTLQHKVGGAFVTIGSDTVLTAPGGCLFTSTASEIQLVVSGGSGDGNDDLYVNISPVK
ncbi:MAG: hypothetical protein CBC27_03450 [Opitutia bacterium TMED67]|nr:MAG: hypothetical protein CBC27_03450 [Opitutae bacterium TMED67]|tara:strand:+ start:724 stop:1074 length:351 start_codon:yes stop_codon:yes gene_type:complete